MLTENDKKIISDIASNTKASVIALGDYPVYEDMDVYPLYIGVKDKAIVNETKNTFLSKLSDKIKEQVMLSVCPVAYVDSKKNVFYRRSSD